MATDFRHEGVELYELKVENPPLQNGSVQGAGDLVDVDPDPPKLALHLQKGDRLATAELGLTMQPRTAEFSASPALTAHGLDLKALIEQLREQVQNVE